MLTQSINPGIKPHTEKTHTHTHTHTHFLLLHTGLGVQRRI